MKAVRTIAPAPFLAHRTGERQEREPGAEAEKDAEGPRPLWSSRLRAWSCADPACSSTAPSTNGTPARSDGRINATNPCSEYALPRRHRLQSRLAQPHPVYSLETGKFDIDSYKHASAFWTLILEISVSMAQFPSESVARKSYDFRTRRPALRQSRRALDGAGHSLDFAGRPGQCAALTAILHAAATRPCRDGGRGRSFPALRGEQAAHAAGDPQPPPSAYNAAPAELRIADRRARRIDARVCPARPACAARSKAIACWRSASSTATAMRK